MVSNNLQKTFQEIIRSLGSQLINPNEIANMQHS